MGRAKEGSAVTKSVDGADRGSGNDSTPKEPKGPRLRVLVVRHGVAEDPAAFAKSGRPDAARPLTKAGRRKMRQAARGLACLVPRLDRLATSPFARTVETAEIVASGTTG